MSGYAKNIKGVLEDCERDAITEYCRLRDIKLHYGE